MGRSGLELARRQVVDWGKRNHIDHVDLDRERMGDQFNATCTDGVGVVVDMYGMG